MRRLVISLTLALITIQSFAAEPPFELPADVLRDKIHGAMLGQIFGNLNGLPHEMKYIDAPGNVLPGSYMPDLAQGARTDDDTDIEWIDHLYMEKENTILLPPPRIVSIYQKHLNKGVYCANLYARGLMDLGIEPPLTGRIALNPWAVFNIWAQFGCESFGVMAPAMPQTACRIGLHYTQVSTDGEPAQVTQFLDTILAMAYVESDVQKLIDHGLAAVDPKSEFHALVRNVRQWHKENPKDWRVTRQKIKETYTRYNGAMPDKNGVLLNTAACLAGILYGEGDFAETLRHCFNFGWDADNTAATAGAILGTIKGRKWFDRQGWKVKDVYENTTRDGMPKDETITSYSDRVLRLAQKVILESGGRIEKRQDHEVFIISRQSPANVMPLPDPLDREPGLRAMLSDAIATDLRSDDHRARARAAYLVIALGEAPKYAHEHPREFAAALESLRKNYPHVVKNLFDAPLPRGPILQQRARAAGLEPAARK
jgi:hypothetical protein